MHNNEWSLIFFTLISQLSAGMIILFSFIHFQYPNYTPTSDWWKSPELIVLLLVGIAAVISLLHLGKPINAPKSLNNLLGSWISKEILTLGLFAASVFVLLLFKWFLGGSEPIIKLLYVIASLCGIIFIYSMSRIYTISTIPSWNNWYTLFSFFTSVTIFALIGSYVVKQYINPDSLLSMSSQTIIVLLAIVLGVIALSALLNYRYLSDIAHLSSDEIIYTKGLFYQLFLIRIIVLLFAIFILILMFFKPQLASSSFFILLSLIILQEFIGRFMFYKSFFRIGV